MENLLMEILQAVATVLISACAAFLIQFLRCKSEQIGAQIDNITDKALLDEVTDAVTTAVAYTSQTYVDALKKGGIFDKDAQEIALRTSIYKVTSLLSKSTLDMLEKIYGNSNNYLTSKIEAEVRKQKNEIAFTLPAMCSELVSTVEPTVEKTED